MQIVETSPDPFAVVAAGNAVLNRAYGRPTATVIVEQKDFEQTNNPLPSFEDVRNELTKRGMTVIELQPGEVTEVKDDDANHLKVHLGAAAA
jgi:hypothetical protein